MLRDDVFGVASVDCGDCHHSEVERVDLSCNDGLETQDCAGGLDYGVVTSVRCGGMGLAAFDIEAALVSQFFPRALPEAGGRGSQVRIC